jgi:PAS domain S-box-containing protein
MTGPGLPRAMWLGLALIVAPGLVLLAVALYLAAAEAPELKQSRELVSRAFEVIVTAQSIEDALKDAERAQRGFLITGNSAYLEPYRRALVRAPQLVEKLKALTTDDAEQQRRLPVLQQLIDTKLAELKKTLEVYHAQGIDAARGVVMSNIGLDAMLGIEKVLDAAIATENALLRDRQAHAAAEERATANIGIAAAMLAFVVMVLGGSIVVLAYRNSMKIEAARHESDERLRLFINGVTDYGMYMLDPEGYVIEWNAGAERMKGYASGEVLGQHFSCFYTKEDREADLPQRSLERAVREGKYEQEAWRVRKDGSKFLASVLIEPLRDRSGRLAGFAKITRDVTELRQQQHAMAHYQKMDAVGQLTGGIAHDFNNLLHVIQNAVEQVRRKLSGAEPQVRRYLDMLSRNAERASSLTQRLLAFSRQQMLDPKPIDPSALLSDVSALLRQALGESVAVETVLGAGAWSISADANQLETAILNLALNARDAMPQGGKLTIEAANSFLDERYAASHADVKAGQYVMIAASDTGQGMTAEVLAKAFDPFFTTKDKGRGTGLGLSQVYGFVKQSGGHIKIYSEPGEGTTVKLYLPRLYGSAVVDARGSAQGRPAATGSETILVVEDEKDVRDFTAEILDELGYRVVSAEDAAGALQLLEQDSAVSLLFTDVGLPNGVNGRQLADQARRRWPALKVLFTTAYTRNAIIHHGRLDPDVEFIAKPFTPANLGEKIRAVLDGTLAGVKDMKPAARVERGPRGL